MILYWIFKFHTFLETRSQDISRGFKFKPIWGASQVAALQGVPPCKACQGYKRPQAPPGQEKEENFLGPALYLDIFYMLLLSSKHIPTHKNTQKTNQSLLILLFTKNTRYCSYTQLLSLVSTPWIWGLRGMDVAFYLLSIPLFSLKLHLAFFLLALALITWFIALPSMFLAFSMLFSLFPYASMFVHVFVASSTCFMLYAML